MAGCIAVVIGGCATVPGQQQRPAASPEEAVQARAQGRWDALVKGDVPAAYGYLSPSSRALNTVDQYRSSIRTGFWKAAKVDKVTCGSADSCDASVTVEYEFKGSRVKTPVTETWIRNENEWWYVLK